MQGKYFKRFSVLLASVATAAFMLGGCSGSDGKAGADGQDGLNAGEGTVNMTSLTAEEQAKLAFEGEVTGVTINSPPVVNFKVTANGNPVVGLGVKNGTQLNNIRFALAKLVPGTNGSPSKWVSYIVTNTATPAAGSRPTTDNTGTLVDNLDGSYTYTFYRDITTVKDTVAALTDSGNNRKADLGDLTYDPTLTHRLAIQIGGDILNTSPAVAFANPINLIYDFIPATGKVVTAADTQREIVTTTACNECHGDFFKTAPHAARIDARYCAVCHTSQRAFGRAMVTSAAGVIPDAPNVSEYVVDGEVLGDFPTMIHKIHAGSAIAGTSLSKTGYDYAGFKLDKITGFPMSPGNCRVCHKAENSLQGDNWNMKPSRLACGSCHDDINFATGAGHPTTPNGISTDASCTGCHTANAIKTAHMQVNKTVHNPEIPAGLVDIKYDIASAAVASNNDLSIKFRILGNDVPVTLATPAAGLTASLSGFTGGPSFLLAYAQAQDGIAAPADYNNLGKVAGQPATVSIANLLNTNNAATIGSISGPDASGYYTATILGTSTSAFPVGAKMRAVGLQGYYTQVTPSGNVARHAVSVIKPVTGDAARRSVVDPFKCGKCHEWLEFHGGNRVFDTQLCVTCHNPNLSTSGRTITNVKLSGYNFTATQLAILTTWDSGFNKATVDYSLTFPEFTNNFKEMIHGIHAGKHRTNPVRDVRNGSGTSITLIDASGFTYPNLLKNCESCHVTTPLGTNKHTFKANLPAGVLVTTNVTNNATLPVTIASKLAARSTVPNAQDIVAAPVTGSCVSCHDTPLAKAHIALNGGQLGAALNGPSHTDLGVERSTIALEQCVLCHGEGKVADVVKMHAR